MGKRVGEFPDDGGSEGWSRALVSHVEQNPPTATHLRCCVRIPPSSVKRVTEALNPACVLWATSKELKGNGRLFPLYFQEGHTGWNNLVRFFHTKKRLLLIYFVLPRGRCTVQYTGVISSDHCAIHEKRQ